jgi:hypothetical protein
MMSGRNQLKMAPESRGSQPVECVHRLPAKAPKWSYPILQIKGFAGGVPPNTETTAVNPRVGIAEIAKRCEFFF